MEGKNILKMVQSKLSEKEEIIHVQQGQIQELTESLEEKNEVIVELMRQIDDLTEKVNSGGANATGTQENEEVIREQMQQIFELSEKVERLEADLARATEHQAEFESLQKQLKEMLDLYDSYQSDRDIFSNVSGGTKLATIIKENTIVRMREISQANENTASAYNTLFASLLGDTNG